MFIGIGSKGAQQGIEQRPFSWKHVAAIGSGVVGVASIAFWYINGSSESLSHSLGLKMTQIPSRSLDRIRDMGNWLYQMNQFSTQIWATDQVQNVSNGGCTSGSNSMTRCPSFLAGIRHFQELQKNQGDLLTESAPAIVIPAPLSEEQRKEIVNLITELPKDQCLFQAFYTENNIESLVGLCNTREGNGKLVKDLYTETELAKFKNKTQQVVSPLLDKLVQQCSQLGGSLSGSVRIENKKSREDARHWHCDGVETYPFSWILFGRGTECFAAAKEDEGFCASQFDAFESKEKLESRRRKIDMQREREPHRFTYGNKGEELVLYHGKTIHRAPLPPLGGEDIRVVLLGYCK